MLLVACYKQHGTIHDATLLKATVACYKLTSCMVALRVVNINRGRMMLIIYTCSYYGIYISFY